MKKKFQTNSFKKTSSYSFPSCNMHKLHSVSVSNAEKICHLLFKFQDQFALYTYMYISTRKKSSPLYLDSLGDLVDVLGLDEGLEVVLQDLSEEVLQLWAPEVGEDLRPVRGVLKTDIQQTSLRYFSPSFKYGEKRKRKENKIKCKHIFLCCCCRCKLTTQKQKNTVLM